MPTPTRLFSFLMLLLSRGVFALPPAYHVEKDRLVLENVSAQNPMIYDNDFWTDVPDAAYLWAKASASQCSLRGNIVTRCTFGWENGYVHTMQQQIAESRKLLALAKESGLQNIPEPIPGAQEALRRPASGKIEETRFTRTPGSDLIVAEAKKASPQRPLLVYVGGSCTTVASAYLTDPAIAERMIVFQVDGGSYNGSDGWAWEITMRRCRFANWARGYFWDKIGVWKPDRFKELPRNPLCDWLREYASSGLGQANQWGDGAWIYYTFDPRCLTTAADYDAIAITIPREATNVKRIEHEFFAALQNPAAYHETGSLHATENLFSRKNVVTSASANSTEDRSGGGEIP